MFVLLTILTLWLAVGLAISLLVGAGVNCPPQPERATTRVVNMRGALRRRGGLVATPHRSPRRGGAPVLYVIDGGRSNDAHRGPIVRVRAGRS